LVNLYNPIDYSHRVFNIQTYHPIKINYILIFMAKKIGLKQLFSLLKPYLDFINSLGI